MHIPDILNLENSFSRVGYLKKGLLRVYSRTIKDGQRQQGRWFLPLS